MRDYTNSEIEYLIDEHIHSARDRLILKLCYIDGHSHEAIAEKVDLSPRRVSAIISECTLKLSDYLEKESKEPWYYLIQQKLRKDDDISKALILFLSNLKYIECENAYQ